MASARNRPVTSDDEFAVHPHDIEYWPLDDPLDDDWDDDWDDDPDEDE